MRAFCQSLLCCGDDFMPLGFLFASCKRHSARCLIHAQLDFSSGEFWRNSELPVRRGQNNTWTNTAQLLELRITQPPISTAQQKGHARSQSDSPHLIASIHLKVMGKRQGKKTQAIFMRQQGSRIDSSGPAVVTLRWYL